MIRNEHGIWGFETQHGFRVDQLVSSVRLEDHILHSQYSECSLKVKGNELRITFDRIELVVEMSGAGDTHVVLDYTIKNVSPADVRVRSVGVMEYQGDWSTGGPLKVSKEALVFTYPAERCYGGEGAHRIDRNESFTSYWFLSVHDPVSRLNSVWGIFNEPTGLVRFQVVPIQSHTEGYRVLRWKCSIDCHSGGRGVRLPAGSTMRLGQLYMGTWKGSHYRGMSRFAEELARSMRRALPFRNVSGWCSWYAGYRDEITEGDCLVNLEAMREYPGMECFQVDDGWMKNAGGVAGLVHEPDVAKFPGGMDGFAKKLRRHDKTPGIWVRPFRVTTGQANTPMSARQHCHDLSRPETRILLRDLMQRVCSGWGYEYVKMDFLTYDFFARWGMELEDAATHTFQPYDDTLTNIQMYRLGLEALREGAGDDCFLLGCNCLVGPALGIVDGFRIGDDIDAENWDRMYTMGVRAVAPMHFLNGRTWWNDPDCIVVHEPMDIRHVVQWATLVAVNGGMGMVSSKLMDIPDERRDVLRKILPVLNLDLRPLDLDKGDVPAMWGGKVESGNMSFYLLAVFNWSEENAAGEIDSEELGLETNEHHCWEFWESRYQLLGGSPWRVELPAHGCKVFAIRPVMDHPQVIGTTGHYAQGAVEIDNVCWDENENTLVISSQGERPFDVIIATPSNYSFVRSSTEASLLEADVVRIAVPGTAGEVRCEFRR